MIEVAGLSCRVKDRFLVTDLALAVRPGEIVGLLGENGAGKTTLIHCLGRLRRPSTGRVLLDGMDIWALPSRLVARRIATLLQDLPQALAMTVAEIVSLGRLPHERPFRQHERTRARRGRPRHRFGRHRASGQRTVRPAVRWRAPAWHAGAGAGPRAGPPAPG